MPKLSQVAPQPLIDSTDCCTFNMIKADWLRAYSGKKLPFFQEVREMHPEAIMRVTLSYADVVNGTHTKKMLAISHRWMTSQDPDIDGEQLKAIKKFLLSPEQKEIELVWIDSGSMPQHQPDIGLIRSGPDTADFKLMLSQVRLPPPLGVYSTP